MEKKKYSYPICRKCGGDKPANQSNWCSKCTWAKEKIRRAGKALGQSRIDTIYKRIIKDPEINLPEMIAFLLPIITRNHFCSAEELLTISDYHQELFTYKCMYEKMVGIEQVILMYRDLLLIYSIHLKSPPPKIMKCPERQAYNKMYYEKYQRKKDSSKP